ncbi:uncharacterized protein EDB93DRAFT_1246027 [Suillus bovinus]|uniref:uncharacterized protein n=1 Tax=Suillus bovinus TaxID=48563 RepID=UPI001B861AA6|nr:uncharacterized protein EDB93DRAFT_1246027 [Suillus bovinus]KAG2158785.1 hypothetical protein EDB93DRAFT_1246027 [Suillus bovinus]
MSSTPPYTGGCNGVGEGTGTPKADPYPYLRDTLTHHPCGLPQPVLLPNRIATLQNKFHDYHNEFESTGAGIVPLDAGTAENLHVKKDFPWYNNLYKIWGSNPSFAAKTTSPKPGSDHAGNLFALTCPGGNTVCSPPQYNVPSTSGHAGSGTAVPQFNYPPPPHPPPPQQHCWFSLTLELQCLSPKHPPQQYSLLLNSTSPLSQEMLLGLLQHWNYGLPLQGGYAGGVAGSLSLPAPQFNFVPPQQSVPPSSTLGSPQRWDYGSPQSALSQSRNPYSTGPPPALPNFTGTDNNNNNPLADEMEDLRMDESVGHCDIILDSPPKSNHHTKKCQQPSSSPTPPPPSLTCRSTEALHLYPRCTPSVTSSNNSCSSLGRGCTGEQSSLVQHSPTSQTSVSAKSKGKNPMSKHIWSEIQEQVEMLNNDLDSIHSEKVSLYQLKNERLMVKMNSNCQQKEHNFIHEERANEHADAAIVHQCMKEAKEVDIRLHEADTKALEVERDVIHLRIEYAKLNAGKNE